MRYATKRLTIVNKNDADKRIDQYINKHAEKMSKKGWIPRVGPSAGNAFFYYEAYVYMCKPKDQDEKEWLHKNALDVGWSYKKGIYSWV